MKIKWFLFRNSDAVILKISYERGQNTNVKPTKKRIKLWDFKKSDFDFENCFEILQFIF